MGGKTHIRFHSFVEIKAEIRTVDFKRIKGEKRTPSLPKKILISKHFIDNLLSPMVSTDEH